MPSVNGNAPFEMVGTKDHSIVVKINAGKNANDVLNFFIQQGALVNSFNEILPSLNDIFIKLVEGTPLSRQFEPVKA